MGDSTSITHPAIGYLRSLFKEGDRICIVSIDPHKAAGDPDKVQQWFTAYGDLTDALLSKFTECSSSGRDLYVCMNAIKAGSSRRTKDDIASVRSCYIDIDRQGPTQIDNIDDAVFIGKVPEPSFIFESSEGRRQVIWLMHESISIDALESLNKSLIREFASDTSCFDAPRILRIPTFPNNKYPDKPLVKILRSDDSGSRYFLDDFKLTLDVERSIAARPPADDSILRWTVDRVEMNLRDAGIDFDELRDWGQRGWMWTLPSCPWSSEHEKGGPGGAALILMRSAACDFKCQHDHCSARGFAEFKALANELIGDPKRAWVTPRDADPADFVDPSELNSEGVILAPSAPTVVLATPTIVQVDEWRTSFRSIGELKPGGVQFLIEGFLHEGSTFFGAIPGQFKTWLGLSVAKALTTGDPFLGRLPVLKKVPVLYLVPEVSQGAFRKRAEKFRLPDDETKFLVRTLSEGPTLGLDHPHILAAVREMNPLVILDTFIHFNTAEDENSSAQSRAVLEAITGVRVAGAPAVVSMHHSPKSFAEGEITLESCLRGSSAIGASADCVWAIRRDEVLRDNGRGPEEADLVCVKPREFDVTPAPLRLASRYRSELTQEILSYFDLLHDFKLVTTEEDRQSQEMRFLQLIAAEPDITTGELSKALKVRKGRLNEIASKLGYLRKEKGKLWTKDNKPPTYVPGPDTEAE